MGSPLSFAPKTPIRWTSRPTIHDEEEEEDDDQFSNSSGSVTESSVQTDTEHDDCDSVNGSSSAEQECNAADGWGSLSEDLLFQVFVELLPEDRLSAGLTCKAWYATCSSRHLWAVADGRAWAKSRVLIVRLGKEGNAEEDGHEENEEEDGEEHDEHEEGSPFAIEPIGDFYMRKVAELSNGALVDFQVGYCSFAGLAAVIMACQGLLVLNVEEFLGEVNSALLAVAGKCPQLQVLSIGVNQMVDLESRVLRSGSIMALAHGCPHLEDLSLKGCRATHGQAELLVSRLPELRHINAVLGGIWAPEAEFKTLSDVVQALASNCPNLESVSLESSSKVTDGPMLALLTHCTNLTGVNLCGERITGEGLHLCKGLHSLSLQHFSPEGFSAQQLAAPHSTWGSEPDPFSLHEVHLLKQLAAGDAPIAAVANRVPPPTWNLRSLDLGYARGSSTVLAFAAICPHLVRLHLRGAEVSDDAIGSLAQRCPQLTDVDISSIKGLTDQALVSLAAGCSQLSVLDCRLDPSELRGFSLPAFENLVSSCPKLTDLKMNLPIISHQLVVVPSPSPHYLSALPTLHTLSRLGTQLQRLTLVGYESLSFDDINPALAALAHYCPNISHLCFIHVHNLVNWAIEALASSCAKLTHLSIHGERVTDASLVHLASSCLKLEHLDITHTHIRQEDMEAFRKHQPQKQICIRAF